VTAIKKLKNILILFPILTFISFTIYFIQIEIYKTPGQTIFYLLQDLAFVPIQALIVTFLINTLMNSREKKQKLKKINVIISSFFAECGTSVIGSITKINENLPDLRKALCLDDPDFDKLKYIKRDISDFKFSIAATAGELVKLKEILLSNKTMILMMLENSSLLEHDSFTDMLWAVFHVADELFCRDDLADLPKSDTAHLNNDIARAYRLLVLEWLDYMRYLRAEYTYLFSLAVRKNPFSSEKNVIIHG
jgi:hypothetical protein